MVPCQPVRAVPKLEEKNKNTEAGHKLIKTMYMSVHMYVLKTEIAAAPPESLLWRLSQGWGCTSLRIFLIDAEAK